MAIYLDEALTSLPYVGLWSFRAWRALWGPCQLFIAGPYQNRGKLVRTLQGPYQNFCTGLIRSLYWRWFICWHSGIISESIIWGSSSYSSAGLDFSKYFAFPIALSMLSSTIGRFKFSWRVLIELFGWMFTRKFNALTLLENSNLVKCLKWKSIELPNVTWINCYRPKRQ